MPRRSRRSTDFSGTRELTNFNSSGAVSFTVLEDANTSSLVVAQVEPECSPADLVFPFGVLGLNDAYAFVDGFFAGAYSVARLAEPFETVTQRDVAAYLDLFFAGCPAN